MKTDEGGKQNLPLSRLRTKVIVLESQLLPIERTDTVMMRLQGVSVPDQETLRNSLHYFLFFTLLGEEVFLHI